MESQLTVMLADIMAQLIVLTQTICEVRKDQQVDHEDWPSARLHENHSIEETQCHPTTAVRHLILMTNT